MFDLFRRIRVNFVLTAILTIILGIMLIAAPALPCALYFYWWAGRW